MEICILFLLICSFAGSSFGGILADSRSMTDQELSAIVSARVARYIDGIAQRIRDAGLDPIEINRAEYKNAIVPGLLEVNASVDSLSVLHLSRFSAESVGYVVSIRRLAIDIGQSWTNPLNITVGNAELELNIFNNLYKVELSGTIIVDSFVVSASIDFDDFDNGLSVTNVVSFFHPGTIKPQLSVRALGNDYSEAVNVFLEYTLVGFLHNNRGRIESILAPLTKIIINALLSR